MEFVEALKSKKELEVFINIWFRETMLMIRKRMEKENNVAATFYLLTLKNCSMYPIEIPVGHLFDVPNGKNRITHAIKKVCRTKPIIALMFAAEAWMAEKHIDQKHEIDRINREGVRNEPDRQECVLINKETKLWSEGNFYELIDEGEKRKIGKLIQSSKDTGGRFTNLLYSPKFKN